MIENFLHVPGYPRLQQSELLKQKLCLCVRYFSFSISRTSFHAKRSRDSHFPGVFVPAFVHRVVLVPHVFDTPKCYKTFCINGFMLDSNRMNCSSRNCVLVWEILPFRFFANAFRPNVPGTHILLGGMVPAFFHRVLLVVHVFDFPACVFQSSAELNLLDCNRVHCARRNCVFAWEILFFRPLAQAFMPNVPGTHILLGFSPPHSFTELCLLHMYLIPRSDIKLSA